MSKHKHITLITIRNIIFALSLLIITFGAGYRIAKSSPEEAQVIPPTITDKTSSAVNSYDFSLFWDVWERLQHNFIDKKALDPQKMIYGAISGMVNSLGDPYTVFLPPDQNKEVKDDLSGKFEGIGAQLGVSDKKIVVIAPLKGAPAEKSGLKPGDWIIKVDGKDTVNWTLPEAVTKIRGPKGSEVALTIQHKDASSSSQIKVVRDTIEVASVEWSKKQVSCTDEGCVEKQENCPECAHVIYLKLARFGDQTNDEWNKVISEIKAVQANNPSVKGLVFDLRNNPGGYLSGSIFIASEFLKDGVVVTQQNSNGSVQTYKVNRKGQLLEIPIVVLINKGSASASEIVAGALKDRGRGKTVGETSFGKGSVQEAQDLRSGAGIHITTAKWLLPSGKWINGVGIEPDIKVEASDNVADDTQLYKAYEVLLGRVK